MNKTASILVSSCDKFSSAWHPFFTLLNKYWPDCPYNKYLNTETLSYEDAHVVSLHSDSQSWTSRLSDALKQIDSDFIVFVLEDFFLMGKVRDEDIYSIINIMSQDDLIAVVYPKQIADYSNRDNEHPEWIRMDYQKNKRYLVNCQFGIWNRKALLDILMPGMTPWELEREYKIPQNCKYKFYCLPHGNKYSIENDVFPYYFAIEKGYGIAKSKWLWNNKKLFKKEGISVNFDDLGVMSYWDYQYGVFKKRVQRIFKING